MMEENFKDITNDLAELKANIRQIVNKYGITYLGIDIVNTECQMDGLITKDITLSIEI